MPGKTTTNPEYITENTFAKCEGNSNEYSDLFVVVVSNSSIFNITLIPEDTQICKIIKYRLMSN